MSNSTVTYRWLDHFSEGLLCVVLAPHRCSDAPLVVLFRFEGVRHRGQLVLEALHTESDICSSVMLLESDMSIEALHMESDITSNIMLLDNDMSIEALHTERDSDMSIA